jgi:hypothetical protein
VVITKHQAAALILADALREEQSRPAWEDIMDGTADPAPDATIEPDYNKPAATVGPAEQSDEDAAADQVASARGIHDAACTAVTYLAGIVSETVCQYAAAMTERTKAADALALAELAQARIILKAGHRG